MHSLPRPPGSGAARPARGSEYRYGAIIRFAVVHLACLGAIWTGVSLADVVLAAALYAIRMFAITAGYHRYFSHRSFKTNRAFAFVLAVLAQTSAQTGVLWWAAKHRHHHRHADTADDVHSPVLRTFWYAHVGWIFHKDHAETDLAAVPDLAKYPELVWLDRHPNLPTVALGLLVLAVFGWSGLVVGFLWSTVALWHATFAINSVAHVIGRRRYLTGDQSRNNWWLALLTFGEGWHNNHHHYQSAARQGFRWHEVDITYYGLRGLSVLGLVWDLKSPPRQVVRNERPLGRATIEKAARQLAASFQITRTMEDLTRMLRDRLETLDASIDQRQTEFSLRLERWRERAGTRIEALRVELYGLLPVASVDALPSLDDVRARAAEMFVPAPSFDEIIDRAYQILDERVGAEIVERQLVDMPGLT